MAGDRRRLRLADAFWRGVEAVTAALLLAMIVLVFTNVVLRYGFSSGLRQSVELSRLGFVWLVMLGAAAVLRRGQHLAAPEFSQALFPRAVPLLRRLAWAIILGAALMLFWGALKQTLANWANVSPLTGVPTGVMYLAGAVSGALMAAVAAARLIDPSGPSGPDGGSPAP